MDSVRRGVGAAERRNCLPPMTYVLAISPIPHGQCRSVADDDDASDAWPTRTMRFALNEIRPAVAGVSSGILVDGLRRVEGEARPSICVPGRARSLRPLVFSARLRSAHCSGVVRRL